MKSYLILTIWYIFPSVTLNVEPQLVRFPDCFFYHPVYYNSNEIKLRREEIENLDDFLSWVVSDYITSGGSGFTVFVRLSSSESELKRTKYKRVYEIDQLLEQSLVHDYRVIYQIDRKPQEDILFVENAEPGSRVLGAVICATWR